MEFELPVYGFEGGRGQRRWISGVWRQGNRQGWPSLQASGSERNGDVTPTDTMFVQNSAVAMKLIPAGATIAELGKNTTDCEEKAKKEPAPEAPRLREGR